MGGELAKSGKFHFARLPTVAVAIGIAILLGLGFWQLQRLGWKNEMNASRLVASVSPPIVVTDNLPPRAADFTRLRVRGEFAQDKRAFVLARTVRGEFGYHLLMPLKIASGEFLLVDTGWVPDSLKGERLGAKNGTIEGYTRVGLPKKNFFVPNNDPKSGFWSHIDVAQIAEAMEIAAAPYYLQAVKITPTTGAVGDYPLPQPPQITLRNEHLQYALTWFAMAVALLGVFLVACYEKPK